MSRASFVPLLALSLAAAVPLAPLSAQYGMPQSNDALDVTRYSDNQLDNLVGPIALYPDALLAQVLVAATFPDQVEDAARWVRENGTAGIDEQSWDVSVKSVAHYQSALNMMADKGDWTATLGRAYAYQSSDVMAAVQRMRRLADAQGNLVSTPQQQVVRESESYVIVPAQPRVIYVPVYDPVVVYSRPIFNVGFTSRFWSFGVGFPIGGWLNYDLDWGRRAVYYNGWNDAYFGYGGGWRARSRPFIQVTNIYVSPRYRDVYVNRNVVHRTVNYRNVDRYAGYHRDVYFDSRRDGYRDGYRDARADGRNDGRSDGRNTGRNDGRNDGRDRGGFPYGSDLGRTAQPRSQSAAASPDGYRNGLPQRDAVRNDSRNETRGNVDRSNADRGNDSRSNADRGNASRDDNPSSGRSIPSGRRSEPSTPGMTTRAPSAPSAAPARGYDSRSSDTRRATQPRSAEPRASQSRPAESRATPSRSSDARSTPSRSSDARSTPTRSAPPRGSSDTRGNRDRRGQ